MINGLVLGPIASSGGEAASGPSGAPGAHRYWRMLYDGPNATGRWAIAEQYMYEFTNSIDVIGGGTSIAGSTASNRDVTHGHDRLLTTEWVTDSNAPASDIWYGYDYGLGNSVEVSEVAVTSSDSGLFLTSTPEQFLVQWSDDGVSWTTAWAVDEDIAYSQNQTETFVAPYSASDPDADLTRVVEQLAYIVVEVS